MPDDSEESGVYPNKTNGITNVLQTIQKKVDFFMGTACELRIICEPTGVSHQALLRLASQLGMSTNLVSGEAVAHCRRMIQNDGHKTDPADTKTILTVARMGKLIKHRKLESGWGELRELHRIVMVTEEKI